MQISVPHGHILAKIKWKNSKVVQILRDSCNVIFEDKIDCVDFFTSRDTAVVVLDENYILQNLSNCKRSLVRLRQINTFQGVVLIEKNIKTQSHFQPLQKFAVLDLGLKIVPYICDEDVVAFLTQMVYLDTNPKFNLISKPNASSNDENVLTVLSCIPKLGITKSKLLIKSFPSLYSVCNASVEELTAVVGRNIALEIKEFFMSTKNNF